ncbi:glycosyltransferase family 4 protein [Sphingobacteriales bacterium CHB3]|nr:glycosyltransferase family 4 protein [Sphingobacteriales bacterium CHB3]
MHIGMDVRKCFDYGIGTYIQNLLSQLERNDDCQLTLFAEPDAVQLLRKEHRATVIANPSPKYSIQELFTVSAQANKAEVELFHSPHYTLPYNLKSKRVVTIHDTIHLCFPQYFSSLQRAYAWFMIRHACTSSDMIIVDSDFTKDELLKRFPTPPGKIRTIHLGVSEIFFSKREPLKLEQFRAKYNILKPYILYTGSLKPHKNVGLLVRAFARLKNRKDRQLIFTGENVKDVFELNCLIDDEGIRSSLIDLGRLANNELLLAYQGAQCVVLPSLHEGFGLSLVEAMATGTPVLGANATSIPEVLGGAVLLFDPFSVEDLTSALERVDSDSALRDSLIKRGKFRSQELSWEQCAKQTMEVYNHVVG